MIFVILFEIRLSDIAVYGNVYLESWVIGMVICGRSTRHGAATYTSPKNHYLKSKYPSLEKYISHDYVFCEGHA